MTREEILKFFVHKRTLIDTMMDFIRDTYPNKKVSKIVDLEYLGGNMILVTYETLVTNVRKGPIKSNLCKFYVDIDSIAGG